eukprot:5872248-Pyramimonas_sp.AAC.1
MSVVTLSPARDALRDRRITVQGGEAAVYFKVHASLHAIVPEDVVGQRLGRRRAWRDLIGLARAGATSEHMTRGLSYLRGIAPPAV